MRAFYRLEKRDSQNSSTARLTISAGIARMNPSKQHNQATKGIQKC